MSDLQEERKQIESYMKDNNLEDMLNDCINELVRERPEDPFLDLSQTFESKSKLNAKIIAARAREVLSATGEPAFEAEIETIRGTFRCIVSDMGSYDEDENRYRGKGLLKAVEFTTTLLADKLLGKNPINQSEIDGILGGDANSPKCAVLALSVACCKAAAKYKEVELYEHIAQIANISEPHIPMPWFNIVNGGVAGENVLYAQSISLVPVKAESIQDALTTAFDIYSSFPTRLAAEEGESKPNIGKLGGYSPTTESVDKIFQVLAETAKETGQENGVKFGVTMNVENYCNKIETEEGGEEEADEYEYELSKFDKQDAVKVVKSSGEMVDLYYEWLTTFPLIYLEDAFDKRDTTGLIGLKEKVEAAHEQFKSEGGEASEANPNYFPGNVGGKHDVLVQLVGNQSIQTPDDIARADEKQIMNAINLNLGKAGSVTKLIELSAKAERLGMPVVLGCEEVGGGLGGDVFSAHVAVGLRASMFKAGGLLGGVGCVQYNELIRLSNGENGLKFVGGAYLKN